MKYVFLKKLSVSKYFIIDNAFSFWTNNNVYLNDEVLYEGDIVDYHQNAEWLYIQVDFVGEKCIINIQNHGKKTISTGEDGFNLFIDGNLILRTTLSNDYSKSFLGLFNFSTLKDVWLMQIEGLGPIYLKDTSLYFSDNLYIHSNKVESGSENWCFDLSEIGNSIDSDGNQDSTEITSIVGVYENKLWLHVTHTRLIALDVETGNLLHEIQLGDVLNLPRAFPIEDALVYGDMHIDDSLGVIKSLSYRYYWELDLNTLKGVVKRDFGKDYTTSWRITRSHFYKGDKNLYFIGAKNGEAVNRAVGIFDSETCEIIWYQEPLDEKPFLFYTDTPQRNNKYLAVLDSDCNLWVYENDEINL